MTWQADGTVLRIAHSLAARAVPGEEIEAFVARGTDTQILVRDQSVESMTSADSGGAGVRVRLGRRIGFAYTGRLDSASLDAVLADARDNARFTQPSDSAVLPAPDGVRPASFALWREECPDLPVRDKIARAHALERLVTASPRVQGVKSVTWGDAAAESAVVSSLGIESYSRRTSCFLSGYVLGVPEGGRTATSTAYTMGRSPAELDLAAAADEAVEALVATNRAAFPARRLPVVLGPAATAAFLGVIGNTLGGRPGPAGGEGGLAQEEFVASRHVTLLDDPTDPTGFGAARFDAEGLATRRNLLVDGGRSVGRLYDAAAGHRAGAASNGAALRAGYKSLPRAGARALALVPGDLDPAAAVAGLDHGFLVQGVSGLQAGAGPRGAFSAAVSGRVVRGGELAEYVPHTTLAATFSELLLGVRGVGNDSIPLPGNAKGTTLLVSELAVGGQ
ncbi:TldD/PmbA family protein [Streptomyces sp. WAC07149]|uniref:TldD/PmbA family protein n=1 Tax=Streptomyces sp. WAC07149 TaxID=2487425 RepID=UPI000F794257|nr:TldD/PmbA family protein [Streptomyces sp. WAC07149]RST09010.1 TldD/PmbA family protein [Streptomyces sp. WAC07149]